MNQATPSEFISELSRIATDAEGLLNDLQTVDFPKFAKHMIAIRGTADQLRLPEISQIASLGEEIAIKAADLRSPNHIRKCLSCLWDVLTTVKHMLQNQSALGSEERDILNNRLETILRGLGGRRDTVSADEIAELLRRKPS